jgi:hypothetical protein
MGTTSYKYLRGNIYQEEGIKLARSATLGRDTVIGQVFPLPRARPSWHPTPWTNIVVV